MKRGILFLFLATSLFASPPPTLSEIKTKDGRVFTEVTVRSSDANGVRLMHSGGFAVIKYSEMDDETRAILEQGNKFTGFALLDRKSAREVDEILGRPSYTEKDQIRSYEVNGMGFYCRFVNNRVVHIGIEYFPPGKKPQSVEEVAKLMGEGMKIGPRRLKGIVEYYEITTPAGFTWDAMLTPGDVGYSVVNLIVL